MNKSRPLQKASKNPPKPHGIKGRVYPIRLFHNLWVVKQITSPNCPDLSTRLGSDLTEPTEMSLRSATVF